MVLELQESCHNRLPHIYTVRSSNHHRPALCDITPLCELPLDQHQLGSTATCRSSPMRRRRRASALPGIPSHASGTSPAGGTTDVSSRRATIDPAAITSSRVTRRSSIDPFPTASTRRASLEPSITKRSSAAPSTARADRVAGRRSNSSSPLTIHGSGVSLRAEEDFNFKVCTVNVVV